MSNNRLIYDKSYAMTQNFVNEQTSQYMLFKGKYYNDAKCRVELGVVGGNGVSLYNGNLVDLESELRGQTNQATKCTAPFKAFSNSNLVNQASCQMQYYPTYPIQSLTSQLCNINKQRK